MIPRDDMNTISDEGEDFVQADNIQESPADTYRPAHDSSSIEGVVDRIVYENPENGFFVARLNVSEQEPLVTFVGNLMAISPGETVHLSGSWVEDRKFGQQFRVTACKTVLPNSAAGIEKYLGSGIIPGIGATYAKRLVHAFGVETLKIIDENPERLRGIPGIGKKRASAIRESWSSHRNIQSIMLFLQSHGVSPAQSVRIYKQYGDAAVAQLRANPYVLARDISGIGFLSADRIARELGIAHDAVARLKAGVLHVLDKASSQGHMYYSGDELRDGASVLLGITADRFTDLFANMVVHEELRVEEDCWYLPAMYAAEKGCAASIKRLVRAPLEQVPIQIENALKWVEKRVGLDLSPEQGQAIRVGVNAKMMVITGGPGTGKTTVINSLLSILEKKGLSFLLTAPTGRAVKRMEAATGNDAYTIHRLLEFSPKTGAFQRNENNPIKTDLLVLDEGSMLDTQLAHALFRALEPGTRVILVGDIDQLPSVGPGNVLLDIIASGVVPIVRLQTVFRQAMQSGIITNAHRINRGEMPVFNESDFFLIERSESEKALETIVEVIAKRLPNRFDLHVLRDIQALAPMRRGQAGVENINQALKAAVNSSGTPIPRRLFGVGDKVMQTRNNYELDVYNGDMGIVMLIDEDAAEIEVRFEDEKRVIYSLDETDDLTLAYCATVHKSQGSEYPAVVLSFLPQHYMMLQRNVLYTAITRAKKIVVIVGTSKAVSMAVHNSKIMERNTRLADRLRNAMGHTAQKL
ncbi:MAG: ATP-dependent RecD-like DNA helicase [Candidatus Hydrogenedentes bacterium]|nr:ATP-dependent RecD-like DNA helicase [Candidatus Hydrogenedentota bacterium]